MHTLFVKDFTILDTAILHPSRGALGDSFYVSVELSGALDQQGFIFDFGPAKKRLKALVDETLDHKLLVPGFHPELKGTLKGFTFENLEYEAPAESLEILETKEITLSFLENFLNKAALEVLPENVESVRFQLREESFGDKANFRYTHGLRLHDGNCQRLIHGHRNPIEVWIEGSRSSHWEQFLAKEWEDVHFAHQDTLSAGAPRKLALGKRDKSLLDSAAISYESPQGYFQANLPASRLVVLDREPSIENIARLGALLVREAGEKRAISVRAYEGLNKGASFSL